MSTGTEYRKHLDATADLQKRRAEYLKQLKEDVKSELYVSCGVLAVLIALWHWYFSARFFGKYSTLFLIVYFGIQRFFRYYRHLSTSELPVRVTPGTHAEGLHAITPKEREEISHEAWPVDFAKSRYEFPYMVKTALSYALFRTYGIPSISKVLVASGEFQNRCPKRYEDTALIIEELFDRTTRSERSVAALNRMNTLHGWYKSDITNDDMLYTLSVFIVEPPRFINRYEWRKVSPLEEAAGHECWKEVGRRMGIKDIPDTYAEMDAWNQEYERKAMVPAESNTKIAEATTALFVTIAPPALRPFIRRVIIAFMDERLRLAMGYAAEPAWLTAAVNGIIAFRALLIKYVFPPRLRPYMRTPDEPGPNGYVPKFADYENVYKDGYRIETLGPKCPFETVGNRDKVQQ